LGRGRGRGRGKASVTASPVASAVEPPAPVSCEQTTYDGIDDYFTSSDAGLQLTGALTICAEVYVEPGDNTSESGIVGNVRRNALWGGGIQIEYDGGSNQIEIWKGYSSNFLRGPGVGVTEGVWVKVVGAVKSDHTTHIAVYESSWTTNSSADTNPIVAHTRPFLIGNQPTGLELFSGKTRNVEYYTGAPSDLTTWIPGNTSSLSGTTLVLQCAAGNGTNDQGFSFTTNGAPVTAPC
jgi:hypothetical protein